MATATAARRGRMKITKNHSPRSRPQIRGRGQFKGIRSNAFSASRIDEVEVGDAQNQKNVSEDLPVDTSESSDSSDDDDSVIEPSTIKSYQTLLQTLNTRAQSQGLARKRLKTTDQPNHEIVSAQSGGIGSPAEVLSANDVDLPDDAVEELEGTLSDVDFAEEEPVLGHDPFQKHFSSIPEEDLARAIKSTQASAWTSHETKGPQGWKTITITPSIPVLEGYSLPDHLDIVQAICTKKKLQQSAASILPNMDGVMNRLMRNVFIYKDVLFCDRVSDLSQEIRAMACLHVTNHVLKTRDRILKNSLRLTKSTEIEDLQLRDQGFTRPKVLYILPTRQSCARAINTIVEMYQPEQQENKKRFQESYEGTQDDVPTWKPEDFRELFGGNDDDMFRIGLKFTRKNIKYFSPFYSSDMIFASPLGLRMAMGTEGSKNHDFDYLSSIEIVIVDQADAMLMQNWEHIEYIFDHLNRQPKEAHGADFSRVRDWYLDGNARYLRQTILLTAFNTPEMNRLFNRQMLNITGKTKIHKETYGGVIADLRFNLRQVFYRIEVAEPAGDPDARFSFFCNTVVSRLAKQSRGTSGQGQGMIIFIPSYMDFVRVRNYLATSAVAQDISFGSISEYTSQRDIARARSHFQSGRFSVLLYTGRAHHFKRFDHIRGVKHVVMYALPENPSFYAEVAGMFLEKSIASGLIDHSEALVRVLFSKWDALKLERVVGTKRLVAMIRNKSGDTFEFDTI